MELNRLYRRALREQKKPAAADVRQAAGGGSPMSAPGAATYRESLRG
jgi:hypothetical protein